MSTEEQRLARLLKNVVPEPRVRPSADEITAPAAGSTARSWTPPALAAAAVVAIGVTAGLVATHTSGPDRATAPLGGSSTSARTSPRASATCGGHTVTVPNVVGEEMDAAGAIIQGVGLNEGIYFTASARVPPGTVLSQSPGADSRAVPGAEVELEIASSPSTGTAASIDPGMALTATPTPLSPCQAVAGTPPAANATQRVPNVVGMMASQARRNVNAAGFNASMVITAAPASRPVPPGTVFAQTPAPGSSARPGSGVILYVAPAS
jgi:PASTA domain